MDIFERRESEVRGYCRSWPTVFTKAKGHELIDEAGRTYLDFFAGAGALNYGHNPPGLMRRLVDYIEGDGIIHGLDMFTAAKAEFLETFESLILEPRSLDYKVQFSGPTGTNAVEAALKLARKVTGRERVVGFTNGFHGMTLGSLAVTGNAAKRQGAGVPLNHAGSMPYAGFLGDDVDTMGILEAMIVGESTGFELPAAVIVETTQGEGGINPASETWLRRLFEICDRHEILMIADDIQVGCGRTGPFFSWENMGFTPDIVTLSKSLSGAGLPLSVLLFHPELDVWAPGEHNGTFRGNNAAFVTATAAMETFWADDALTVSVGEKGERVRAGLAKLQAEFPQLYVDHRGRGLIWGLETHVPEAGAVITAAAFERGILMETAGAGDEVVKLLPPLIIPDEAIDRALTVLGEISVEIADQYGDHPDLADEVGATSR